MWLPIVFLFFTTVGSQPDELCTEPNKLIYKTPGNVSITGIFDVHGGENCSDPMGKGWEEAAAAAWVVSILNQQNYLPGIEIGLYLYDGCTAMEEARKSLIQEMVYESCRTSELGTLGTLVSPNIKASLEPFTSGLNKTLVSVGQTLQFTSLFKMAMLLMKEMSINTVHRLIGSDQRILKEAGQAMAEEGVCVYDEVSVDDFHGVNNDVLQPPKSINGSLVTEASPFILVLASSSQILQLFNTLSFEMRNMTDVEWLLVPTDAALNIEPDLLPKRSYVLSAVMPDLKTLQIFLTNEDAAVDPMNHKAPSKSPFFLSVASAIISILKPFKTVSSKCADRNESCSELGDFVQKNKREKLQEIITDEIVLSKDRIINILTTLKLAPDNEMFLFTVNDASNNEEIAVFQNYDPENSVYNPVLLFMQSKRSERSISRVVIDDIVRRTSSNSSASVKPKKEVKPIPMRQLLGKHPCYEPEGNMSRNCGICSNFVKYLSKVAREKETVGNDVEIGWRFEAWVGINASVAAIGVLCCLTVILFIFVRMCSGDVLEGNPFLSFLLLFAIIILYFSCLPFSFQVTGTMGELTWAAILCDLRIAVPPISYAILFSITFSRSVMLAACDQDGGFMSHVNGYVQGVLIFFTLSVQLVISGEYWLFNSFLLNPSTSCQLMYDDHRFVILLSYDVFLLVLQFAVTPFMYRSKRNYFEGAFFTIATFVLILVWSTWLTLFFVMPSTFTDAIVTLGMTSTATVILVCVFIPRTYLMTTSIVRDRIVSTLPPLPNSDFRSTQALYDSININGKTGTANPNFYSVNPTDSGPCTPQIQPGQYYSSNVGLKVPSPRKDNFTGNGNSRALSPEHTYEYEGCNSPVHDQVNVTRF